MSGQRLISRGKEVARRTVIIPGHFSTEEKCQKAAHVCAICEEGGDLLFCDGPCKRHFHEHGVSRGAARYFCQGIVGLRLRDGTWKCPDCSLGQAKCFGCLLIGTYEGVDGGPPLLRQCPDPLCIRFYCFTCLPPEQQACLLHKCDICDQPESAIENMVHCLRCPKAWHYDCLRREQIRGKYCPHRDIYEHTWKGQTRYMFYCHLHILDPHLGTPIRNHLSDAFQLM